MIKKIQVIMLFLFTGVVFFSIPFLFLIDVVWMKFAKANRPTSWKSVISSQLVAVASGTREIANVLIELMFEAFPD